MSAEDLSRWSNGDITRDDCIAHAHLEWKCSYTALLNPDVRRVDSPLFSVGDQTYALSLYKFVENIDIVFCFELFRKGPSVDIPLRWWAGLKRSDGTYHHRNEFGVLPLDEEFSTMKEVETLLQVRSRDFYKEHAAKGGHFTFVFQMKVASINSNTCIHGTPEISLTSRGSIARMECTSHKRVYWDVEGRCLNAASPVFQIAEQEYFLEFSSELQRKLLRLYRRGPSVDGPSSSVRWWAGLKHGDGTFCHKNRFGNLDLGEEFLLWTKVKCLQIYSAAAFGDFFEKKCHGFTAIFQINVEQESTTEEACAHGIPGMSPSFLGTLTENHCSSHKRVEWNLQRRNAVSPVFQIGNQRYLLEMKSRGQESSLYLHRMGPSVDGSVRWWAGLKRDDGSYLRWIEFGDLDLKMEFSMFAEAECLLHIEDNRYSSYLKEISDDYTVFFQINVENASTTETCLHDAAEAIFPVEDGQIRDDGFTCHKKVEWSVDFHPMRQRIWTSRAFSDGEQHYRFVFTREDKTNDFYLYRLGPSSDSTRMIEFSAGLKRGDGTDHHKYETGLLFPEDVCELWSEHMILASVDHDDFTKYHLSDEGRFTFVFRMDVKTGEQECNHGATEASSSDHGEIEENECPSHKHVEWRGVDFLQLVDKNVSQWVSPVFSIEDQSYALTLSRADGDDDFFNLELLRKGPSVTRPPVRWRAGMKFRDGNYDYRNTFGELKLEKKLSGLTVVKRLLTWRKKELTRYLQKGRLTAFFQLKVEHASTTAETCTHGTPEISRPFHGELVRNDCASHKRVEWNVESQNGTTFSQVFEIENQRYLLELSFPFSDVVLNLYRKGPSCAIGDPAGYLQWWAGLKRSNGTHDNRNECGVLNLEETFSMWTEAEQLLRISSSDFKRYFKGEDGGFTAVFQMNVGNASTTAETCHHDFLWMSLPFDGTIKDNKCTSHMRVDWDVRWNINESKNWALSPVFEVENQRYLLELRQGFETTLNLYRMGPSVDHSTGSIRWWAGLRSRDGIYHPQMKDSGDLNKAAEFWMWAKAEQLLRIQDCIFRPYIAMPDGFSVFFQMNIASTTSEKCNHDPAEKIFPLTEGEIKIATCNSHRHVEWKMHYKQSDKRMKIQSSAAFLVGNQRYRFLFSTTNAVGTFHLYRLGPSVDHLPTPVQWWAGLKRRDSTYQNRNATGELFTHQECEFWSEVAKLTVVELGDLPKYHLDEKEHFTFFYRVNQTTGGETCIHDKSDRFPVYVGGISEEKWTSYKLLHWNVDFDINDDVNEDMASPVFVFNNQKYLLELVFMESRKACPGSRCLSLHLCRKGPPCDRSVQWWAGVRHRDGTFQEFGSDNGKLSLELPCRFWTYQNKLHSFTIQDVQRMHLTVDVLMSLEKSPPAEEECTTAGDQAPQDVDNLSKDDIVFIVNGERFQMPKALIRFEAPALGALFQHDNVESQESEVNIVDCEPAAFGEFLELLKGGFDDTPTEENAFHLYTLADKYLLRNLQKMCLPRIRNCMSVDTFCEVARLYFRYQDEDLLNSLVTFLRENGEITNIESFVNLKTENPKEVDELLAKAFPPTN